MSHPERYRPDAPFLQRPTDHRNPLRFQNLAAVLNVNYFCR
jgi:hypothetical protein